MRVVPLEPDIPPTVIHTPGPHADAFMDAVDAVAQTLQRADKAENAYASGADTLQDAVLERARADVALAVATAAAQRTATALQSVLNLQI